MLDAQSIYGRDAAQSDHGPLSLGRALYPTVPEDAFDMQPLTRGRFSMVADARLDNRDELADALRIDRERLKRMADSALLFECVLAWGESAANRLVGEFAFAYWNEADRSLLLGRDLLGNRPLFFHRSGGFFAFASMPSGLHSLPGVPREFDVEVMAENLANLPYTGPRSYFRCIERVPPGHLVRVTRESVTVHSYWTPPSLMSGRSPDDYADGLRDVFEQAVRTQMRGSDGVVGTHLSSGLDSSIITATAARLIAPGKVLAFTAVPRAGFAGPVPPETIADEREFAAETASLYPNVEHVIVESGSERLQDVLDRQFAYNQEPAGEPAGAEWGRAINREAQARGTKVLLIGIWGNLTISYSGLEFWSSLVTGARISSALRVCRSLLANGIPLRTIAAQAIGPLLPAPAWKLACRLYGRPTGISDLTALNPVRRGEIEAKAKARGHDLLYRPTADAQDLRLSALLGGDTGNFFKGILAEFGISMRVPTSDKRVVEYCLAVPPEEFIRNGVPRGLARTAFADRLPPSVANFQHRGFQAAGWYEMVERDLPALRIELDAIERCGAALETIDARWLKQTLDTWPTDGWARRDVSLRYRYGLLSGLAAGHFMRKVSGTN